MKFHRISQADFQIDTQPVLPQVSSPTYRHACFLMYTFSESVTVLIFFLLCFFIKQIKCFVLFPWKKNPTKQRQIHDTLSPTKLRETENKELLDNISNRWRYQISSSTFSFLLFLIFCDISFSLPLGENPSVASSVYARTRDFTGWSWPGWKYCCSYSSSAWLSWMHTGRVIAISETSLHKTWLTTTIKMIIGDLTSGNNYLYIKIYWKEEL